MFEPVTCTAIQLALTACSPNGPNPAREAKIHSDEVTLTLWTELNGAKRSLVYIS